ncbi:MAG: hypothetical protein ACOZF0_20145 [Thermodesulfobacteriota bacterium]
MKKKSAFLLVAILMVTVGYGECKTKILPEPRVVSGPKYRVEELDAMMHEQGIFVVSGKIRNMEANATRGYVIVYFADEGDRVVDSSEAEVNESMPIEPGQTGFFELSKTIASHELVQKTFIEYVERERVLKPIKPLIGVNRKP